MAVDQLVKVEQHSEDAHRDRARRIFLAAHRQATSPQILLEDFKEAIQWMDGFGEVKAVMVLTGPLISKLFQAGRHLDRNSLTKLGRALQKHGSRPGPYPTAKGSAAEINSQG